MHHIDRSNQMTHMGWVEGTPEQPDTQGFSSRLRGKGHGHCGQSMGGCGRRTRHERVRDDRPTGLRRNLKISSSWPQILPKHHTRTDNPVVPTSAKEFGDAYPQTS